MQSLAIPFSSLSQWQSFSPINLIFLLQHPKTHSFQMPPSQERQCNQNLHNIHKCKVKFSTEGSSDSGLLQALLIMLSAPKFFTDYLDFSTGASQDTQLSNATLRRGIVQLGLAQSSPKHVPISAAGTVQLTPGNDQSLAL